ncbi:MAG: MazG nucleotide pyrophosphohydrolase domain-containing protein [Candidatus Thorarchaeota archaeon]
MDLSSLAGEVDKYIQTHGGYWDAGWLLAAITEELGELSRALQNFYEVRGLQSEEREKSKKMLIEEECGDLFFAFICLTNFLDINLEIALYKTLKKYKSRENGLH